MKKYSVKSSRITPYIIATSAFYCLGYVGAVTQTAALVLLGSGMGWVVVMLGGLIESMRYMDYFKEYHPLAYQQALKHKLQFSLLDYKPETEDRDLALLQQRLRKYLWYVLGSFLVAPTIALAAIFVEKYCCH